MEQKHLYTSKQKLEWFGPGEWVEEPDEATFEHEGFKCIVCRIVSDECYGQAFGGHFCGYVQIPPNHPWYGKAYNKIECECHGGLTFASERFDEDIFWVGFDCSHSDDITPSIEMFRDECGQRSRLKRFYDQLPMMRPTYKNIQYAIAETQSIAEQAARCISST